MIQIRFGSEFRCYVVFCGFFVSVPGKGHVILRLLGGIVSVPVIARIRLGFQFVGASKHVKKSNVQNHRINQGPR